MQVFREFTNEWQNQNSKFNGSLENNVLCDFYDYCDSLNNDFKKLKKYESAFNNQSKKPLDVYYHSFLKLYAVFNKVIFKSNDYAKTFSAFYLTKKAPSEVLITKGDLQKISDAYYSKLKKLAEEIFKIEAEMSSVVENIWMQNLTSSVNHNPDNYSYLVHAKLGDWRKQGTSKDVQKYVNSLKFMSTSYVNQDKTKFYMEKQYKDCGMVGYILSIKKGAFIAGNYNDMFSTELVDGKSEYVENYSYSPVKKLYVKGNSVIYGNGTRICSPQSAIDSPANIVNEVILDKEFVRLESVFYVKPYWERYNDDLVEAIKKMLQKTENPQPVRLHCFNRLNQPDLEEIYF